MQDIIRLKEWFKKTISLTANNDYAFRTTTELVNLKPVGSESVIPTIIVDDAGNQITSFGSPSTIAEYTSPIDFKAEFAANNSLTLTEIKFDILNTSQLVYIKVIHADNTSEVLTNGAGGVTMVYGAGIITIYGLTPFVTGDVYEVGINGAKKAYDDSTDSEKVTVLNPYQAYVSDVEVPTSALNSANGTAVYLILYPDAYRNMILQFVLTAIDVKLYATLKEDASDISVDSAWFDITNEIFEVSTLQTSKKGLINVPYEKLMVKYTPTNATNSLDLFIRKYS